MTPENTSSLLPDHTDVSGGQSHRVCDYEGSTYETDFWVGQNRDYEDTVERIALRRLLPPEGHTLVDIGTGFGRLADLYSGYDRVILVDYSRSMLRQAQQRLGSDESRYIYVASNVYNLPLAEAVADTVVMVRVIHHLTDVPSALSELARITCPQGHLVLEFANKRNIKAMLRYLVRRQHWNPFDEEPIEFVTLNYNFHPRWIERQLRRVHLETQQRLSVSNLRVASLKRVVPLPLLSGADRAFQRIGSRWLPGPSVFLRARQVGQARPPSDALFRCPRCAEPRLLQGQDCLECTTCGRKWPITNGLYDFKEPI